jgi:Family of unknown function (DUF6167)
MSRVTWFVAGAATGVYGLVRARRAARNFTPDGIAARAAAVGAGLRVLTSEVSAGMAEREGELRDQLAIPPGGRPIAVPAMIERAVHPRHRREESSMQPARDGHRDGHR